MKKKLNVGFVVTKSGRWPKELGERRLAAYGQWVQEHLPHSTVCVFDRLVTAKEDVADCIRFMQDNRIDLLVQVYGAFTGDDVCCAFADELKIDSEAATYIYCGMVTDSGRFRFRLESFSGTGASFLQPANSMVIITRTSDRLRNLLSF